MQTRRILLQNRLINCKTDEFNCKTDEFNCKRDEFNCNTDEFNCKRDEFNRKGDEFNCKNLYDLSKKVLKTIVYVFTVVNWFQWATCYILVCHIGKSCKKHYIEYCITSCIAMKYQEFILEAKLHLCLHDTSTSHIQNVTMPSKMTLYPDQLPTTFPLYWSIRYHTIPLIYWIKCILVVQHHVS